MYMYMYIIHVHVQCTWYMYVWESGLSFVYDTVILSVVCDVVTLLLYRLP